MERCESANFNKSCNKPHSLLRRSSSALDAIVFHWTLLGFSRRKWCAQCLTSITSESVFLGSCLDFTRTPLKWRIHVPRPLVGWIHDEFAECLADLRQIVCLVRIINSFSPRRI